MHKAIFTVFFIFMVHTALGQSDKYTQLNQEINRFNDHHQYDQSITRLEEIITDPKSTAYDLYQAYYHKFLTYKRLFNYTEALNNLALALQAGEQSDKREEVQAQIKIEKLFIKFDLMEFEEVNALLPLITTADLNSINHVSRAFYLAIKGIMAIKEKKYIEGNHYLDDARVILEEHDPKHLPLIYRKKIVLYKNLVQYDKAIESFEKGLFYAKKYKMDIYILAMYGDMSAFYGDIGDLKMALETQHKYTAMATHYDTTNRSGKLHLLEKELLKNRQQKESAQQRKIQLFLASFVFLLMFMLVVFIRIYRKNKNQQRAILEENNSMRRDLLQAATDYNDAGEEKLKLDHFILTERQLEIVHLVKQGKTNKEIGNLLYISENTVKYHLKIIYEVLQISNRNEL
ncbi:response regulator transcription factor [Flavobacterium sp. JP2137]|uniref:helix-turn-helix transcriptional regulator n=1 Tax=Flavobacterium sp. JP2137 TaxID=3414510 RepID=UPI003D2FCC03